MWSIAISRTLLVTHARVNLRDSPAMRALALKVLLYRGYCMRHSTSFDLGGNLPEVGKPFGCEAHTRLAAPAQ